jgi:alpha-beta hydrolase superfamily lysophospholipase
MAYALIPGADGSAWYWHRVAAPLPDALTIDPPAGDDSADLTTYPDTVVEAVSGASGPLLLVAQSAGAFTAPLVAYRVPTAAVVLVNPMVPAASESPGQ